MGKEKVGNGNFPDAEKDSAIGLLITVFEIHDEEKLLNKALDDFLDVYGEEIPGWMQYLYDYLKDSGDNENKMAVVRNFAKQTKMELIV